MKKSFLVVILLACASIAGAGDAGKPNVLIMVADDMGFADVGFNGGDINPGRRARHAHWRSPIRQATFRERC